VNQWFTAPDAPITTDFVKRFDPLHWTVDFPRGAMASAVSGEDGHSLKVEASFLRRNDLVGLIWDSEDRDAHPAHARETSRDYSGCVLQFRWRSTGLIPLNAVNGPTLTIEGRDANGAERSWYVRLWNYASGSATNAVITLDFDELDGGFLLPAEAERVDPRFIDRLFFSLVPPGYDPASNALIGAPAAATLHFEQVVCDGPGSVLTIRDAMTPEHDLRVATAYDDQYHLPPERVLRTAHRLGYRKLINHYVGMSHYMALGAGGLVDPAIALNAPALAWHRGFARAAKALGFEIIWSLSYEILDQFCPQRRAMTRPRRWSRRPRRRQSPSSAASPRHWRNWPSTRGWNRKSRSASPGGGSLPITNRACMTMRRKRRWADHRSTSATCVAARRRRKSRCWTRPGLCLRNRRRPSSPPPRLRSRPPGRICSPICLAR
jgi:hypothetical protein